MLEVMEVTGRVGEEAVEEMTTPHRHTQTLRRLENIHNRHALQEIIGQAVLSHGDRDSGQGLVQAQQQDI